MQKVLNFDDQMQKNSDQSRPYWLMCHFIAVIFTGISFYSLLVKKCHFIDQSGNSAKNHTIYLHPSIYKLMLTKRVLYIQCFYIKTALTFIQIATYHINFFNKNHLHLFTCSQCHTF